MPPDLETYRGQGHRLVLLGLPVKVTLTVMAILKSPIIARKMIQKATMEGNQITKVADFQGDVMVVYRRTIDVKGHRIKALGNGGRIRVHMNNDGTVINAFRVWRDIRSPMIDGHMVMVPVKSFEDAFEKANTRWNPAGLTG